eukprot:5773616-Pyramimonas_sp.AAC.1
MRRSPSSTGCRHSSATAARWAWRRSTGCLAGWAPCAAWAAFPRWRVSRGWRRPWSRGRRSSIARSGRPIASA